MNEIFTEFKAKSIEETLKGTVYVFSSDHPCKDDNAGFTKVPLKALPYQDCL